MAIQRGSGSDWPRSGVRGAVRWAAVALLVPGCASIAGLDEEYVLGGAVGGGGDGASGTGASTGTGATGGGGSQGAAGGGGTEEPCLGEVLECNADGSARRCVEGAWSDLGPCPLGCDADSGECRVPSNVDAALVGGGSEPLEAAASVDPLVFDTDTGEIRAGSNVVRPAGEGLDPQSGIAFTVASQGAAAPGLGVFSMTGLTVAAGATARGIGANALVLLVDGNVQIDGTFEVLGDGPRGGPGGYGGGAAGASGLGPCAGQPGAGAAVGHYCTSGSGAAGYGGPGSPGGACNCPTPNNFVAGLPGGTCGNDALVPLIGGSGGAGGSIAAGDGTQSQPGAGGGGGGALQLSASGTIVVGSTGRINAGGSGGGETINGGGAGAGSGGAILLEAPNVSVAVGAVLAANGGGGGGGDCT